MTDETNWYSEEMATFGDRLAAAREAAKLSQAELAERLGVTEHVIDRWETDAKEPRANRLSMLAGLLGVSLSWLLTGRGEGVDEPGEEGAVEISGLLAELRSVRADLQQSIDRVGRLEKRLRRMMQDSA